MDQLEGEDKYKFFYCKKDKVDLTEMKNINFYIRDKNMTFVLEPKNLFYEYNGYLYYLIIYKQFNIDDGNKDFEWTFGTTFLKKYILTFDTEDKLVYYYSKLRDGNDDFISKNEEEEESNSNLKYIILIIILSVVFISSITFFLIYINKIKPRKKKANELDEEFEYNNKNEKKDKEENNDPLMINE